MENNNNIPLANRLIALGELSSLTAVDMPQEQLLALFSTKLHTLFGAKALALWFYDRKEKTVTLKYSHDLSDDLSVFCKDAVPADQFPEVKYAIDSGVAWTTEDLNDTPLYSKKNAKKILEEMGVRAVMGVPLRALANVLGAISLYYEKPHVFDFDEKALALAYANSLALSLNNVEAYSRLVALEQVKNEVINIVAHQFRTPIATLRGNVELLKEVDIQANKKEFNQIIGEIEKVGIKLRMFVESFLNVKAIDEGDLDPKPQHVSANLLVDQVIKDLEKYRNQHKVDLTFNKFNGNDNIFVDQLLIHEAVTNVVNNAIKYAKSRVMVKLVSKNNDIVLEVTDDGAGIPEGEQQMIFQKLYRASNVLRHPEASSGLGMFIAKQYINSNGGKIWFTSAGEGKGSTFYVSFPIKSL
ncbi:MAG: GAF domain-containing sensor histidine kinase [bacterium]|nr:GAF domain-containing sensor histidine kinase [bacterium]